MTNHEGPEKQEASFLPEGVASLEKAQEWRNATPESDALQQASEERRRAEGLETEEDRRDRRGDSSVDDGYIRGPGYVPRLTKFRSRPVSKRRSRSVHLRHDDEPSESDEFHNMAGGYLSRTSEDLAEQQKINDRGKPLVLAALKDALTPQMPPEPTPEEKAVALQVELDKRHAEVNAYWDAVEAAIAKKNS